MYHNRDKTQTKVKRTVLSLLNRRSTKVEPETVNVDVDDRFATNIHTNQQNHSAHSTPIKRLPDIQLRRHCSSQNISNVDHQLTVDKKTKNLNPNRLSQQFGLCCSTDSRAVTPPPITVRYKSLPDIELNKSTISTHTNGIGDTKIERGETLTVLNEKHKVIVHQPPPISSQTDDQFSSYKSQHEHSSFSPTAYASTSCNISSNNINKQVFTEIQNSIAASACRSRLREKIIGKTSLAINQHLFLQQHQQQHSSDPNISSNKCDYLNHHDERSFSHDGLVPLPTGGCTDSLVQQSLIAAQLLHLIPTEKARERNYLSGRLAVTSLFGLVELERVLPTKEVKIFVGTWNMNEQNPPKQMNDFVLPNSVEHIPDIVVIGTQESCSLRFEWEVTLQETLGPSHILLHSASLGTLHLAVFIRRDLIWFCSEPEDDSLSVRSGSAFRTKGAVAISFCLFGTAMLFVTSHLTAHQEKVKERVQDVKRIIHSLDLPRNLNIRCKNRDVTQNFDSVYWCGDLNFRLGEPREKVLKWIANTKFPLPAHMPHGYLHTDQLKSVLAAGAAFKDFKEAHITFPPTYKYDTGTQNFDTSSKQRTPAYTDRILYKFKSIPSAIRRGSNLAALLHSAQVECLAYDSVPSIVTSDHKPVWALFRNPIRPGIDSVPLAAGLFNREVYLEGMKRRLSNSRYQGSSAVCVIQ